MSISTCKKSNPGFFYELKSAILLAILVLFNTTCISISSATFFALRNRTRTSFDVISVTILYLYLASSLLMFVILIQNARNNTLDKEGLKNQGMLKENIYNIKLVIYCFITLCFLACFIPATVIIFLSLKEFSIEIIMLYFVFPLLITVIIYLIPPTIISLSALNMIEYPVKNSKKISPVYVPLFLIIQLATIPLAYFDNYYARGVTSIIYTFLVYFLIVFLVLRESINFNKIITNHLKNSKEKVWTMGSQKKLYVPILIGIVTLSTVAAFFYSISTLLLLNVSILGEIAISIHFAFFILDFILLNALIIILIKK